MKHQLKIYFRPTESHQRQAIKALLRRYPDLEANQTTGTVYTFDENRGRALFDEAKRLGFATALEVSTLYGRDDALSGELGILSITSDDAGGNFNEGTFDFSTGCPLCGLGAAQVKPLVLSERSIHYNGNFNHGAEWSGRVIMRSEIGQQIIDATNQPWCMRHPVTDAGCIVQDWMEPVPCATMPPLSSRSEGVLFGSTGSGSAIGEPVEVLDPCPVCKRTVWDYDCEQPTRLMYPACAIEAAQRHAVLVMHEPWQAFPEFNPVKRTCEAPVGLPWLLFSRKAIEVLVQYLNPEKIRTNSYIEPVFAEE